MTGCMHKPAEGLSEGCCVQWQSRALNQLQAHTTGCRLCALQRKASVQYVLVNSRCTSNNTAVFPLSRPRPEASLHSPWTHTHPNRLPTSCLGFFCSHAMCMTQCPHSTLTGDRQHMRVVYHTTANTLPGDAQQSVAHCCQVWFPTTTSGPTHCHVRSRSPQAATVQPLRRKSGISLKSHSTALPAGTSLATAVQRLHPGATCLARHPQHAAHSAAGTPCQPTSPTAQPSQSCCVHPGGHHYDDPDGVSGTATPHLSLAPCSSPFPNLPYPLAVPML